MSTNVTVFNTTECFNCSQENGTSSNLFGLIYYVAIDVISVLSNILMATVIYKENEIVSTSSKLLIHQAVADMGTGLTYLLYSFCLRFGLDKNLVNLVHSFLLFVFTAESLQLLSVSVFCLGFAICHPILYRVYNRTWLVRLSTLGTWLVNLAVGSLMFIVSDAFKPNLAFVSFTLIKPGNLWYEVLKVAFVFVLPMCGIVSLIIVVRTRSPSSTGVETQSNTKTLTTKAYVVMTLFSIYWACLLFTTVIDTVNPFDPDKLWGIIDYVSEITYLVLYHFICLKLPVFLIVFKSYRDATKRMCCCCSCEKVSSDSSGTVAPNVAQSTDLHSTEATPGLKFLEIKTSEFGEETDASTSRGVDPLKQLRVPVGDSKSDMNAAL